MSTKKPNDELADFLPKINWNDPEIQKLSESIDYVLEKFKMSTKTSSSNLLATSDQKLDDLVAGITDSLLDGQALNELYIPYGKHAVYKDLISDIEVVPIKFFEKNPEMVLQELYVLADNQDAGGGSPNVYLESIEELKKILKKGPLSSCLIDPLKEAVLRCQAKIIQKKLEDLKDLKRKKSSLSY